MGAETETISKLIYSFAVEDLNCSNFEIENLKIVSDPVILKKSKLYFSNMQNIRARIGSDAPN
jgi:hypothetical protein